MIQNFQQGIVLRCFMPYQRKMIVLDREIGRIECSVPWKAYKGLVVQAGLIAYVLSPLHRTYALVDIELVALPVLWVRGDILFLHHILELCVHLLPLHSSNVESVFDLLMVLYTLENLEYNQKFFKQLFLCRFFAILGMYPDDTANNYDSILFDLISGPIDIMLNVRYDTHMSNRLNRWLVGCLATYPYRDKLKTSFFLTNMNSMDSNE